MSTSVKHKTESTSTSEHFSSYLRYFKQLPRMWVFLLIPTLLGGIISYFIAEKNYVPVYTASTTFSVKIKSEQSINDQSKFYDNMAAEQIAQTFPYILTSNLLQRKVADDLGISVVSGTISATAVENANLLTLSVTDTDPQRAYTTLNSVIKNYPSVSEPIVGKVTMNVLDETGVPTQPDNPKNFLREIYKGLLLGLLVGFIWTIILYTINKTVHTENDIKKLFGLECFGKIPQISKKKRSTQITEYSLITNPNAKDVFGEPFRMIRNKIEYVAYQQNIKTLLITSAFAGEGKSLFAANLALSLALSGNKVVLIDCDMRHPTGRLVFKMPESTGLSDYLQEKIALSDYIEFSKKENNHNCENLLFLPGGKAVKDGSTLLYKKRMADLIDYCKNEADFVILDSAPVGILTDSVALANFIDAALMVIKSNYTRVDIINDALDHLSKNDINIIGSVLNGTD